MKKRKLEPDTLDMREQTERVTFNLYATHATIGEQTATRMLAVAGIPKARQDELLGLWNEVRRANFPDL